MLRRLVGIALLASLAPVHAALPEALARQMAANQLPPDSISLLVLRGDETLAAHLPERSMQPASTMKLLTTLVALEQLGPVFRGRTELRSDGVLDGSVLHGDLVLRGGADADFSDEALGQMLRALRTQGIRTITGSLVLDRSLFAPARTDLGRAPFDEAPEAYYNVIPDALLVNKNMLQLDLRASTTRLQVTAWPALEKVRVTSDMALVDGDCASWDKGWLAPEAVHERGGRIRVTLHGSFPRGCAHATSINVLERDDYLDRLVRQRWHDLGGTLRGPTVSGVSPPAARLLAEHLARALPEVVRDTNKQSDNALARTLFLSLGSLESDPLLGSRPLAPAAGTTFERADGVVRAWLRAHAIDPGELVLENGAGLSRTERISPRQLAGVLKAGLASPWVPELLSSMPIAGTDGTLRRRLKDSSAAGRARMKTGTLNNVVAIAGYVPDAAGRTCVVVAMVNDAQAGGGRGRAVLDMLVDWVARYTDPVAVESR